jgi:uncharacterized protein (DUF305 family)
MVLLFSCNAQKPHDHAEHGLEESYTYDPFFLDVIRFQFENEIKLAQLGLSQSHHPATLEISKQILEMAQSDLVQIKKWREDQYKMVPVVTPDEFSLKKLELSKPSDFEKLYLEQLKALTLNGQEIARMGAEQNFEPPIKAYAEKLQKAFTLRLTKMHKVQ